jgi:hypothetical protein
MSVSFKYCVLSCRERSVHRADHSCRAFVASLVCLSAILNPRPWRVPGPLGAVTLWGKCLTQFILLTSVHRLVLGKKSNFQKLDLFRSSHEKYVISLCLFERVLLLPLLGILAVRQSQDTQSELFQIYWNWILLISFSFNGAKITKLLHAHFKLYGLLFKFIFHFDW